MSASKQPSEVNKIKATPATVAPAGVSASVGLLRFGLLDATVSRLT